MKTYTSLVIFLLFGLFTASSFATPLAPDESKPLFNHMVEVNKEWTKMQDPLAALLTVTHFENDIVRIQTHLRLVEHFLRLKDIEYLSCRQQENRIEMLGALRTYWQDGQFPVNTGHLYRQPYFIDDFGTACAVGHLLQESGFEAFAEKVKVESNFAYIREMTYEEIPLWAENFGFTLDELAWIQPGYNPQPLPWAVVGNGGGPNGEIHVMYKDEEENKLYVAGNFNDMDGTMCTSIISWDGTNWEAFANNYEGEIYAIEKHNGHIVIAGDFEMFTGAPWADIAVWNGLGWSGLQIGDMEGNVRTMKSYNGTLYIGGDFQKVNGQNMFYWAAYNDFFVEWGNFGYQPTGPVRQFELVDDKLAIAGDFQIIGSSSATIVANYLVHWDGTDFTWTSDGGHGPVSAMRYFNDHLILADDSAIYIHSQAGAWSSTSDFLNNPLIPIDDPKIHQFQPHNGVLYAVGNFYIYPDGVGYFGRNMLGLSINDDPLYVWANGAAFFDTTVTSAASYDGKFYTGGLFQDVDLNPFNRIAATELGVATSVENPEPDTQLQVYFSSPDQRVFVRYENLREESLFGFYDIQGRAIHACQLQAGSGTLEIPVEKLSTGTYVYQMANSRERESGKVVVVK